MWKNGEISFPTVQNDASGPVAELADARDLKSLGLHGLCGFDPRPGQDSLTD